MLDLNLIRSFVTVCEEGSVTVAARTLGQPKSTISRHLARLEEELGKSLLDRTRTGVALTSEGKRLFEQSRESIQLLAPLGRRPAASADGGHIRIAAPRYFARGPLSKIMRAFMADNPGVAIECQSESRLADPQPGEVDVAISVGAQINGDLDTWGLGPVSARLYAAPALFAGATPPTDPAGLTGMPLLSSCGTVGITERLSLSTDKGAKVTVAPRIRLIANELEILIDSACDGLGLVVLPEFVGADQVAAGRLLPVMPDHWTERFQVGIALLSAKRNPAARHFVDYALQAYKS